MDSPPHENCNFIGFGSNIIIGCYPKEAILECLLKFGVTIFVNLVSEQYTISENLAIVYNLPIASGKAPKVTEYKSLLFILSQHYQQNKIIYIHCHGGHGRAGTIACLLCCYLNHTFGDKILDGAQAIYNIWSWRNTRTNRAKNFIPVPETQAQVKCILQAYPPKDMINKNITQFMEGIPLLDRRDKTWLKKVRADRNKK